MPRIPHRQIETRASQSKELSGCLISCSLFFLTAPRCLKAEPYSDQREESAPPQYHARAPHDRETRVDAVVSIARADAHQIGESAEPSVSASQSAQPVSTHDLIAVEMSPMRPLSPAPVAA